MPAKRDLTGKRFGMLTALNPTSCRENGYIVWKCRCDCGRECMVSTRNLRRGVVKNCGCIPPENAHHGNVPEDLTGRKFGMLTVIKRAPNQNGRTAWLCQCDCGGTRIAVSRELKAGRIKDCGCRKAKYRLVSA